MKEYDREAIESLLKSCPLFGSLSQENFESIASVSRWRSFASGDTVFRQGDKCEYAYVIDSGRVRIFRSGVDGAEHVLHLCGPRQSFAEVAVFAGFDLPANAVAMEATKCVLIRADAFRAMLDSNHSMCRQMLSGMALWTRHFTELLDDLVLRDARDRVLKFLRTLPLRHDGTVELPGPKKDIANHLNVTSETFSRTLKRLAEEGSLELTRDRNILLREQVG